MSRYANWENVVDKYMNAAKASGSARLKETYLTAAEDEIDGLMGGHYTVPFTPVPGMIRDLVVDLTWYKMTLMQEDSDKLKKYIDDRILALQTGKLTLTMSGQLLGIGGVTRYVNYELFDSPDDHGGFSVDDSRRHCY